jgi:hypothetical protein
MSFAPQRSAPLRCATLRVAPLRFATPKFALKGWRHESVKIVRFVEPKRDNLGGERRFVSSKWPEDAFGGSLIVTFKVKTVRLMHLLADRDTATRLRTP